MSIFDFLSKAPSASSPKKSNQFSPGHLLSAISKTGLASTSTFEVVITPPAYGFDQEITTVNGPKQLSSPGQFAINELRLKIDSAELPGRSIKTSDYVLGNQPMQSIGYGFTYSQFNMTVLCNENLDEKVFFEKWQEIVANASSSGDMRYLANYYKNYVGLLVISQFDKQGKKVYSARLNSTYPTLVNPIQVSWSTGSEVMKLNVTMAYHTWDRIDYNTPELLGVDRDKFFAELQ